MPASIFLSYRRADSQDATRWLYEKLEDKFGANLLFMDLEGVESGELWDEKIKENAEQADLLLAIIGPNWAASTETNPKESRLADANDWVRKELEIALKYEHKLIPIVLQEASLPESKYLPASLQVLHRVQQFQLDTGSSGDVEALIKEIEERFRRIENQDALLDQVQKVLPQPYSIEGFIDAGTRSRVYKARDAYLDRWVAIKVLKPSKDAPEFIENLKEGTVMDNKLPHFVHIYGAYTEKTPIFAVTNFMEGGTLRHLIQQKEGQLFHLKDVLAILQRIGKVMAKGHEMGITHGNLKPSNILLNESNEAYISSLSRRKNHSPTAIIDSLEAQYDNDGPGFEMEDIAYIAPEIMDAEPLVSQSDLPKSVDQYMLGLVGYELLTGTLPTPLIPENLSESLSFDTKHTHTPIEEFRSDCLTQLSNIIMKMIAYYPDERYDSLKEMMADLNKVSVEPLEIARDSYARCLVQQGSPTPFFKAFYEQFVASSASAKKTLGKKGIGKVDDHRQYAMLSESIFMLLMFAEKEPEGEDHNVLTRVASAHDREHLNIPKEAYVEFVEAFLTTVCGTPEDRALAFDPQCHLGESNRKRIRKAWEKALEPGIEYMKAQY
ncbi:MAG: protein kinase [Bacteroidota bacterium]